jgi:hypothetical protein
MFDFGRFPISTFQGHDLRFRLSESGVGHFRFRRGNLGFLRFGPSDSRFLLSGAAWTNFVMGPLPFEIPNRAPGYGQFQRQGALPRES